MEHFQQSLLPRPSIQPELTQQDRRTRSTAQRGRTRPRPRPPQSQPRNRTRHTPQSLQALTAWLNRMSLLEPQNLQAPQSIFLTDSQHKYDRDGISWEQFSKILDNLMCIYGLNATTDDTPHETFKQRLKDEIFDHPKRLCLTDVELSYAVTLLIKIFDMLQNKNISFNNIDCLFAISLRLSKFHLRDMSRAQSSSCHFYTLAFTKKALQENANDCKGTFKMVFNYIFRKLDFQIHLPYSLVHPIYQCLYPANDLPIPNGYAPNNTMAQLVAQLSDANLSLDDSSDTTIKTAIQNIMCTPESTNDSQDVLLYPVPFAPQFNTTSHGPRRPEEVLSPKPGYSQASPCV